MQIYFHMVNSSENMKFSEAATRRVLWKKVFLEISQISQENTCFEVFNILQVWRPVTLLTLIWVGFLGVRFVIEGRGSKITRPPLSKTC